MTKILDSFRSPIFNYDLKQFTVEDVRNFLNIIYSKKKNENTQKKNIYKEIAAVFDINIELFEVEEIETNLFNSDETPFAEMNDLLLGEEENIGNNENEKKSKFTNKYNNYTKNKKLIDKIIKILLDNNFKINLSQLSKEFNIPNSTLSGWNSKLKIDPTFRPYNTCKNNSRLYLSPIIEFKIKKYLKKNSLIVV